MRRVLLAVAVFAAVMLPAIALAAENGEQRDFVPPAAIYLPSGANILTEVNVSDDNILGIIKTATSTLLDDLDDINIQAACPVPLPVSVSQLDIRKLVEATYGVKSVRILVARYQTTPEQFIKQFEVGVPKAGKFNRILMDTQNGEFAVAVYAQPDNGGYMGAAYDPREKMIYAARIVGFVDVKQFMDVVGDVAKAFVSMKCGPEALKTPQGATPTSASPAPTVQSN